MAWTSAPVSTRASVSEPRPAPISRTRSPAPTSARRAMRRTVLGSTTKFWPRARLGRSPCSSSRPTPSPGAWLRRACWRVSWCSPSRLREARRCLAAEAARWQQAAAGHKGEGLRRPDDQRALAHCLRHRRADAVLGRPRGRRHHQIRSDPRAHFQNLCTLVDSDAVDPEVDLVAGTHHAQESCGPAHQPSGWTSLTIGGGHRVLRGGR